MTIKLYYAKILTCCNRLVQSKPLKALYYGHQNSQDELSVDIAYIYSFLIILIV